MTAAEITSPAHIGQGGDAEAAELLSVSGLRVEYRTLGRQAPAVLDASFAVRAGEIVAIVGESGSGKTTTAHAALGLLPPEGIITAGRIVLAGQDLTKLSERRLQRIRGSEIGLIQQDPTVSLNPVKRVGEQVAEGLRIHRALGRRAAAAAALDVLASVGIDRPQVRARQYPHELSGGMRQRVLIGIAMACNPKLIVADEPTSALDVTVQRTVLDSLQELTRERGTAVLLITHDLAVALDRADRVVVMSEGRVVESGVTRDVVEHPQHPYTARLVGAAPSLHGGRLRPRRTSAPSADEGEAGRPLVRAVGLHRRFAVTVPDHGRIHIDAVKDVSLQLHRGTTFALVGESGSGKSTTARIVAGLDTGATGELSFDGQDLFALRGSGRRALSRRIQFVYQNPYASLDPKFSVAQIVEEPLRAFGVGSRAQREAAVGRLLDEVALGSRFARRRPAELSGGQRQRVAIARSLALRPDLVVLDEPVSALDVSVQAQILQLLVDLQGEHGLTYLFISHDLAVVRQISDDVAVMQAGQIVEQGTAEAIFANPAHPYTQRLLDAIPGRGASR